MKSFEKFIRAKENGMVNESMFSEPHTLDPNKEVLIDFNTLVRNAFTEEQLYAYAEGSKGPDDLDWTNRLMDSLEDEYQFETKLSNFIKKSYKHRDQN